jgi:hypothetical protein
MYEGIVPSESRFANHPGICGIISTVPSIKYFTVSSVFEGYDWIFPLISVR